MSHFEGAFTGRHGLGINGLIDFKDRYADSLHPAWLSESVTKKGNEPGAGETLCETLLYTYRTDRREKVR